MKILNAGRVLAAVGLAAALLSASAPTIAARQGQRVFATPESAAEALHQAARAGDVGALEAILGRGSADVVASGNPGEDMGGRARFVAAFEQSMRIAAAGARRAELVLGNPEWHFPYPLVRGADGWRFDARAGSAEVIARRIGRNELSALQAMLAFADAQREYALDRHDGSGPGVYAQRIASAAGRHDGLYWTPTREHPLSPLGPAFTLAAADEASGEALPYHGYFFRVLTAQGRHAPGGAEQYVVGGRMIGGFALLAYPARYRVSGVRTFLVSHHGVVYSRDLGARSAVLARATKAFDPGPGWRREAVGPAPPADGASMAALAGERGCTVCHRESPAPRETDAAVPLAPSWREIAARYRGQPDAETRLTHIVLEGADPADRHWAGRQEFNRMEGNAARLPPDDARALVRWILSYP